MMASVEFSESCTKSLDFELHVGDTTLSLRFVSSVTVQMHLQL